MKKKTLTATLAATTAIALAPPASASPDIGCESIRWGFLGSQVRTICDGPRTADGSWLRARQFWTPAHQVPFTCYGGYYFSSCSGGYWVDDTVQARELYIVTDATVLHDEPGWLAPGPETLR